MKQLLLLTLGLLSFGISQAQIDTLTIDSVQWVSQTVLANCDDMSRYDGKKVVVHGIVMLDGSESGSNSHNIQISMTNQPSPFGSIRLRMGDPDAQYSVSIRNLKQGDSIRVIGEIDQFRGETQLSPDESNTAITLYKRNIPVKDTVLSVGLFNDNSQNNLLTTGEEWESAFVTFEDVDVVSVDPFSGNRISFLVEDKQGNKINISDLFSVQKLPAYTIPYTGQPGTFSPPTVGDNFKSISGIITHSKNNCPGETGRGYELNPFKAEHYKYGPSAPKISNKKRDKQAPKSTESVTVSADIKDLDGSIVSATLLYNTGIDVNDLNFTSVAMTKGAGDNYSAVIPAQSNGTFVRYYITAEDDSANVTALPSKNPSTTSYAYRVRDNGLTIYDLQFTPFNNGNSIFVGEEVTVTGVVTSSGSEGDLPIIHIQDEAAISGWSGIELQNAGTTFERGDKIEVTGNVLEDFGKTAISVNNVSNKGTGTIEPLYILPDSAATYGFERNERYESVLVGYINPGGKLHVVDTNADDPSSFAEWKVGRDKTDPASGARILTGREFESSIAVSFVNSSFRVKEPYPIEKIVVTDTIEMDTVIGVMTYSFRNMKLLPRNNDDFRGINVVLTSVKSYDGAEEITIYPNPAKNEIFVNASNINVSAALYDFSGKAVLVKELNGAQESIEVSTLNNGVYILSITDKNGNTLAREKVIVNH